MDEYAVIYEFNPPLVTEGVRGVDAWYSVIFFQISYILKVGCSQRHSYVLLGLSSKECYNAF